MRSLRSIVIPSSSQGPRERPSIPALDLHRVSEGVREARWPPVGHALACLFVFPWAAEEARKSVPYEEVAAPPLAATLLVHALRARASAGSGSGTCARSAPRCSSRRRP